MADKPSHILDTLVLPDRYERVAAVAGAEVANLLIKTEDTASKALESCSYHVEALGRGSFVPAVAATGTGKTTLISNLNSWFPDRFTPTARHVATEVARTGLVKLVEDLRADEGIPVADARCIPINIDDRESRPPSEEEMSEIKAFLRTPEGSKAIVLWLMTDSVRATETARYYERTAGMSPVKLPVTVGGPPPDSWQQIALSTLDVCNDIEDLSELGVDPRTYAPGDYNTVGDFLSAVSSDFARLRIELVKATERKLRLVVVFASESRGSGVLSDLTSGKRFGSVDPEKLLSASPDSAIGRWWSGRRGTLIRTVVGLDARAVGLAPTTSIPILRTYGPPDAVAVLAELGVSKRTETEIEKYFKRSDLGKLLDGSARATATLQGNPGDAATDNFEYLATLHGFGSGKDKALNRAVADHLAYLANKDMLPVASVLHEEKVPFAPGLIPDITLGSSSEATCLELHWRTGEFLTNTHRSEAAQYVLTKLKNYALALGWATP